MRHPGTSLRPRARRARALHQGRPGKRATEHIDRPLKQEFSDSNPPRRGVASHHQAHGKGRRSIFKSRGLLFRWPGEFAYAATIVIGTDVLDFSSFTRSISAPTAASLRSIFSSPRWMW